MTVAQVLNMLPNCTLLNHLLNTYGQHLQNVTSALNSSHTVTLFAPTDQAMANALYLVAKSEKQQQQQGASEGQQQQQPGQSQFQPPPPSPTSGGVNQTGVGLFNQSAGNATLTQQEANNIINKV